MRNLIFYGAAGAIGLAAVALYATQFSSEDDTAAQHSAPACAEGMNPHLPVVPTDMPRRLQDSFIYRDGTRVRARDPEGRPGTVNADGSISYADGTRVAHNSATGDTTITAPDGTVSRTNVAMPRRDGEFYVWGDGIRTYVERGGSGEGEIRDDGSIAYPDGTIVKHDPRTGTTTTVSADGTTSTRIESAARRADDGMWRWNDGAVAPGHGDSEDAGDGWIKYPDGTVISHLAGTGLTKYIRPDGSITLANSCTSEVIIAADTCLEVPVVIDKCMLGTWKLTGGGPLEYLKSKGMNITSATPDSYSMTFNDDGTMRTSGFNFSQQVKTPLPEGEMFGNTEGAVAGVSGFWSTSGGKLYMCFTSGGDSEVETRVRTPKGGGFNDQRRGNELAGTGGSASYSCASEKLSTSDAMPNGDVMKHEYTRVSRPEQVPR